MSCYVLGVLLTLALSEGYVTKRLDPGGYKSYKDYGKKPSATIALAGPVEAHCIHMTDPAAGGPFGKDPASKYVPVVMMTVGETVLLDRYLVDDCRTEQKIRESLVEVRPSKEVDGQKPLRVEVEYRTWDDKAGTAHKQRVTYELKRGAYVRGKVEE